MNSKNQKQKQKKNREKKMKHGYALPAIFIIETNDDRTKTMYIVNFGMTKPKLKTK